jgi:hypothetical protein
MNSLPIFDIYVGEARLINMNFSAKVGANDLTGTPVVTMGSGGPTVGTPVVSGKKVQCLYTATGTTPAEYEVKITTADDGGTAQAPHGKAILKVNPF